MPWGPPQPTKIRTVKDRWAKKLVTVPLKTFTERLSTTIITHQSKYIDHLQLGASGVDLVGQTPSMGVAIIHEKIYRNNMGP